MSRRERRTLASQMRAHSKEWSLHLVAVPESEWPPPREGRSYPDAVWRSRQFLVTRYTEQPFQGIDVYRLSVNRVTIGSDGGWDQNITWDELQRCKRETGHGDWYGVEIYPRDRDIVNVAHMRHLWLFAEPLSVGWFAASGGSR